MMRRSERLPREIIELLAPFFPDFDLSRVRIHEGIPWYVRGKPQGYADRHRIFLDPGAYSIDTIEGIALLAHELTHCRQYSQHGIWRFRTLYLGAYIRNRRRGMSPRHAYLNIPFEIEAREIEENVYSFLQNLRERLTFRIS